MNIKYHISLSSDEKALLLTMTSGGTHSARKIGRAHMLLLADRGKQNTEISEALSVAQCTVCRIKRRFVEGGLEHALTENRRPGAARKLDANDEALLVGAACSKPPAGRAQWTLQLLADKVVVLTDHEHVSASTIGRRLKDNELKPWQRRMWCIPEVDAYFVERMEDVLGLYAEEGAPDIPVVSFDETPVQLIGEVRTPIQATQGSTERIDYEYKRNGTVNAFVFVDVNRPWRHVKITKNRTKIDFAECMRDLVDLHYPRATKIRVVLDNLNIHTPAALYEAFVPEEARRILTRLEFHHTPKHASWLNMVEIEIGVLTRQCLDRRIPDRETLEDEIAAWERDRNDNGVQIEWLFTVQKARKKLGRSYPGIVLNTAKAS